MKLIIFERTNLLISEDNKYCFSVNVIGNDNKLFHRFIDYLIGRSKAFKTYINVYRIYKDNSVTKICWIKEGNLFTL